MLFLCTIWNLTTLRTFHSKYKHWKHWKAVCNLTTDDFFFSKMLYWVKNKARLTVQWRDGHQIPPCRSTDQNVAVLPRVTFVNYKKLLPSFRLPPRTATHRRMHTSKHAYRQYLRNIRTVEPHGCCRGGFFGSGEWGGQCSVVVQMQ